MTRRQLLVLAIGAIAGLFLRCLMLFHMGVSDMEEYYRWGQRALAAGLPRSYHGIYFPLQYQIFELCAWLVDRRGTDFFVIFKLSNLFFDLGSFGLLLLLLRRLGANPLYALWYWLSPWFLAVFSLGYIDFHFSFFVLLFLWLLGGETIKDYLLAGAALGCAFLMKPQAQILIVATSLYCLYSVIRRKDVRPFALLAGPVLLFLTYEAYFATSTRHWNYLRVMKLPASYLNVSNIMPALTAQMTNIWYPIAYLIKAPNAPVHSVSDHIHLLPFLSARLLAASVVLLLVAFYVLRVERELATTTDWKFTKIFGFAAMVVPFLMTSGHENHLFLGSVLLILLMARRNSLLLNLAGATLLLTQFLHIYGLYGTHPIYLSGLFRRSHSDELAIVYSLVSLASFCVIAIFLCHTNQSDLAKRRRVVVSTGVASTDSDRWSRWG